MLATLFLIVVMLNLLISIISATFERVQSQAKQRMYHEFAQLIVENYHLLSPETMKELDSRGRYLYLAWLEESMQANEGEVVCEKLGSMLAKHRKEVVRLVDERLRAEEIPALHAKIDKLSAQVQQALAPSKNA